MEFDESGYVIIVTLLHPLRVEELLATYPDVEKYMDESSHPLHWLIDTQQMKTLPLGVIKSRSTPILSHPKSGYIVLVGANTFVRSVGETIFRLTNYKRTQFFNTAEEGLDFLKTVVNRKD